MAGEKYVLHNKHVTPKDGAQTFSLDFSEKEEALLAIDKARRASLEYEDMVQDVDTRFYEKEGRCVIDVLTYRGNYADSYDEYLLTDKNGNQIDIAWDDVNLAMQNNKHEKFSRMYDDLNALAEEKGLSSNEIDIDEPEKS